MLYDLCYDANSAFEGETTGNAQRKFRKLACLTNKAKRRWGWDPFVKKCIIPTMAHKKREQAKKSARVDLSGCVAHWQAEDDRLVCYEDVAASLWEEGILEQDFYEEDTCEIGGGDWSGAVDIAERKWEQKKSNVATLAPGTLGTGTRSTSGDCSESDAREVWGSELVEYSDDEWETL